MGKHGQPSKKNYQPRPSEYSKGRAEMLQPMLSSMLAGGGLNSAMGYQGNWNPALQKRELREGIASGRDDLQSQLNRMVKGGDTTVRKYVENTYDQSGRAAVQGLDEQLALQKTADREMAQAMSTDLAASGKQMGTGVLDIYMRGNAANQSLLASGGDMRANVMSGIGSLGGWMMAAQDYSSRMSDEKQTT